MLDGVQARLLLQSFGLLLMPTGLAGFIQALGQTLISLMHLRDVLNADSAPEEIFISDCGNVAFYATWMIVWVLPFVAGWRLFLCKGQLFPHLVRSLAR